MTDRTQLSVFVTTYNNDRTLTACLESVRWADEIVILDSFSTDDTLDIARRYGARITQHEFMGYGRQKQMALAATTHDWVLLLDADEALSPALRIEIDRLLDTGPAADGYEMPRQEQLFWRMYPFGDPDELAAPVRQAQGRYRRHADPRRAQDQGRIGRLNAPLYHYGETDIHTKVEKINAYSTGLVADKIKKNVGVYRSSYVVLPTVFSSATCSNETFERLGGRDQLGGGGVHVFLKYAKLYRHYQMAQYGARLLPETLQRRRFAIDPRMPATIPENFGGLACHVKPASILCNRRQTRDGVSIAMQVWWEQSLR